MATESAYVQQDAAGYGKVTLAAGSSVKATSVSIGPSRRRTIICHQSLWR